MKVNFHLGYKLLLEFLVIGVCGSSLWLLTGWLVPLRKLLVAVGCNGLIPGCLLGELLLH